MAEQIHDGCFKELVDACHEATEIGRDPRLAAAKIQEILRRVQPASIAKLTKAVALMHIGDPSLGDHVYSIREKELLGWEGPRVEAWGEGTALLEEAKKELGIGGESHDGQRDQGSAPSA